MCNSENSIYSFLEIFTLIIYTNKTSLIDFVPLFKLSQINCQEIAHKSNIEQEID